MADLIDATLEASIVGSFTRIGCGIRRVVDGWNAADLEGGWPRTVLVTGATSGLGLETARGLAARGDRVILLGRSRGRLDDAIRQIAAAVPGARLECVLADLSRLDDVHAVAAELTDRFDHLDVVVHNAGTLVHELDLTADGLETTVQTHVVAPFLLTALLVPLLVASSDPRVISVVSGGMYTARLSVDALDALPSSNPAEFDGAHTYALAKRASHALTREWARRAKGTELAGIVFHSMHPGWADTPGIRSALPGFARLLGPVLRSPAQAVDTTLWLASADEPTRSTGQLWLDRRRRRDTYLPWTADPVGEPDRLWAWAVDAARSADPLPGTVGAGTPGPGRSEIGRPGRHADEGLV